MKHLQLILYMIISYIGTFWLALNMIHFTIKQVWTNTENIKSTKEPLSI